MRVDTSNLAFIETRGLGACDELRKGSQSAVTESDQQPAGAQAAVSMPGSKPGALGAYTAPTRMVDMYETIARSSQHEPVAKSTNMSGVGRGLMVTRLFGGQEPAVFDGSKGLTMEDACRSNYAYLNHQDRELFSEIYAYAQAHRIDLTHIDWIASDLGDYRRHDNGRLMSNFNNGNCYDLQGRQLSVDFNPGDAAIAARLLNGRAIASTQVDQGFLKYILDPGFGALAHVGHFDVLEHVVNRFSAEAPNTAAPDGRFATCVAAAMGENCIVTASNEVTAPGSRSHLLSRGDAFAPDDSLPVAGAAPSGAASVSGWLSASIMRLEDAVELLRRWKQIMKP